MEIAQRLLKYCSVGLLVLDSLYALFSRDLPGLASTSPANLGGRLMGTAMRDLSALAKRYHVYIIFLTPTFPEAIPLLDNGNKSLAFYSSQRLELQKIDPLISKDELSRVRVRVIKNALDSLPDPVELDINHNVGVSQASEILDLGLKLGLVTRSGPWFSYAGLNLGQGRDNTIEHLTLDRLLADRIQQDVIAKFHESTPKVETPLVLENQG
jgi:recombination protein RecA